MLEAPGQILSTSIYCIFLKIRKPFSNPIAFALNPGLLTSSKKEYVKYTFLCIWVFIISISGMLPSC